MYAGHYILYVTNKISYEKKAVEIFFRPSFYPVTYNDIFSTKPSA